jgi:hypothetical protein
VRQEEWGEYIPWFSEELDVFSRPVLEMIRKARRINDGLGKSKTTRLVEATMYVNGNRTLVELRSSIRFPGHTRYEFDVECATNRPRSVGGKRWQ